MKSLNTQYMDQPKLERLLRLMKLLTANTTYNVDQLAERLQMSRRTIYRYIDTFREAGFVIKKAGDCIRLDKESPHFRDISQLVHFTEEEAVILKSAIENIDDTNLLKQNLKRKLYSVYDNKTLADTVVRGKNAPNIRTLIEAIDRQQQAVLHSYQSPHGGEVRDRRVEPFAFTTNYVQVWCYDPEAGACKLFKTSRIGSVELTGEAWKHEAEHREGFIDVFRMHGGARHRVQLELGLLAYNLLCEEYPLAERDLKPLGRGRWALDTAQAGRDVALVCSGDAGVYGMASPLLELAAEYPDVEVEVVPGLTAALSGAAVLGAPLAHDFCVISLSDRLTPWEMIEKRLACAAMGDFCVALYNPSSKGRPDYLQKAVRILLQNGKGAGTLCGVIRSIGRTGQQSSQMTLAELEHTTVDMFTTVFIGNSATHQVSGWMVTPRGYHGV